MLSALDEERKESGTLPRNRQELDALLQRHHLIWSDLKDPWNSEFIPTFGIGRNDYELRVFSPGPDKQVGTDDDFTVANRSVSFYGATERQVTRALQEYHRKTGGLVRDLPLLRTALFEIGIDLSKVLDPWGHPYIFEFGLNGAQFTVTAKTCGEDAKPNEEYVVGTSAIDYFAETRAAIDRAFYGWGHAGRVETTALAVQLLDRTGQAEDQALANRGLEFLIEQKDQYGTWYSTQTTVNVIDALLLLASRETGGAQAPLRIAVNGSPQALPTNMAEMLGPKILDISSLAHSGTNTLEISGGNGALSSAQTVTEYYVHWNSPLATPKSVPLKLSVTCDRTHLDVGAKATCTVLAERIGSAGHGMMIAEIGIPPGVDVDREGLQKQMSENGWDLSSFDVLPDRIVAYLWPRAGGTKFSLSFTTRMAIDAQAAPHTLSDYYNPDASVTIPPDRFTVVGASARNDSLAIE